MAVTPLDDRVLIKQSAAEEQTAGGIILPGKQLRNGHVGYLLTAPCYRGRILHEFRKMLYVINIELLCGRPTNDLNVSSLRLPELFGCLGQRERTHLPEGKNDIRRVRLVQEALGILH